MKPVCFVFLIFQILAIATAAGGEGGSAPPATQKGMSDAVYSFPFPYQILPRSKERVLVDGVRFDALVNELGPGWMPPNESVGIARWYFDDGAILCARLRAPETKMTFGPRGGMWWEQKPKDLEPKVVAAKARPQGVVTPVEPRDRGLLFASIGVCGLLVGIGLWRTRANRRRED